jgi:signal transduction histidine kinase
MRHGLKFTWILGLCLVFTSLFGISNPHALAQSQTHGIDENIRIQAAEIARQIEKDNLILPDTTPADLTAIQDLPISEQVPELRELAWSIISRYSALDLREVSTLYQQAADTSQSKRDQRFANLLSDFSEFFDLESAAIKNEELVAVTRPYTRDVDWFIAHNAWKLLSLVESYDLNYGQSLEYAQYAQQLIPNEISDDATSARIDNTVHIAYLHNLLRDPELAVENTGKLLELIQGTDHDIDGTGLINNMIYSFSAWRDFETSRVLSDTLLRIEKNVKNPIPGLTLTRVATNYSELGEFDQALQYAKDGLEVANHPAIIASLNIQKAIAHAGLGNIEEANRVLEDFENNTSEELKVRGSNPRNLLRARSYIALANGDTVLFDRLNRELLTKAVQNELAFNSRETRKIQATLQDSKDRQDERETALKREADLKQEALDKQKNVNRLLWVLAGSLAIALVLAAVFARFRTITAKKMEIAAQQARAGEKSKSEFLAVMSHELRTPLNGIMGMADHLSRAAPTEELRKQNGVILDSGQDLLSLVENILDMTLLEANDIHPYPEPTDIRKVLRRVEATWRPRIEKKDIIFTQFIHDSVPDEICTDPRRLAQCVNIIVSNAAKFTLAGRIHMHVTTEIRANSDLVDLKIIVADTGIGISDDAQTRLFKPFVQADSSMTRHYGGAGLGLTIARGLARLMDGDLTLISREGRGTELTLSIAGRVSEAAQPQPKAISRPSPKSLPIRVHDQDAGSEVRRSLVGLKILYIEDNPSAQILLRSLLAPHNCSVTCVDSGQKALKALDVMPFDVAVVNVEKDSLDGIAAIHAIRQSRTSYADVPLIALTNNAAPEINARFMSAGIDIFLTKPIQDTELLDSLEFLHGRFMGPLRDLKTG